MPREHNADLIRGAYHFALPDRTDGATQADYFIAHGGGWSADGHTLPGALDIEYNPYGATCYGLVPADMVSWLHAFLDRYRACTGRDAVIYTTYDWWNRCTANSQYFTATDASGAPIDWTYSNGTHACVKVGYQPRVTGSACAFSFYVPSGHATGTLVFGYWTTDGAKHYASLDENPVSSWQTIFTAANVNRIEFQDNNGQTGTQIGWGSTASYGIHQNC